MTKENYFIESKQKLKRLSSAESKEEINLNMLLRILHRLKQWENFINGKLNKIKHEVNADRINNG